MLATGFSLSSVVLVFSEQSRGSFFRVGIICQFVNLFVSAGLGLVCVFPGNVLVVYDNWLLLQ